MSRTERYKKRSGADPGEIDADNPLPGYMDPITFQPVNNPAISPFGHVMGLATWKVQTGMLCCIFFNCCVHHDKPYSG